MECYLFHQLRTAVSKNSTKPLREYQEWLNQPGAFDYLLEQSIRWNIEDEAARILVNLATPQNFGELLGYAVYRRKLQLTEKLLIKGARPQDALDLSSYCPTRRIFHTLQYRKEMLRLLIRYGLDVTKVMSDSGENALLQFAQRFLKRKDSDALEIAATLIDSGVDLDGPDDNNYSPVHWAVLKRHTALVNYLISRGADVNRRSAASETFPLLSAARRCDEEVMRLLVSNGAEVNAKDKYGWSALHVACLHRHERSIDLLIRQGADISAVEKYGKTPFSLLENELEQEYYRVIRENCEVAMIKEFARVNYKNPQVFRSTPDYGLVMGEPRNRDRFERCTQELRLMAEAKFYVPYTYYEVMRMSKRRLAPLTKNGQFLAEFRRCLSEFVFYRSDLERILREAVVAKNRSVVVENRLSEVFESVLPSVVIRKLEKHLTPKDLPLQ